jgi:arsenate reductase
MRIVFDPQGEVMSYKIYHNPRCSKSRQTLEILTSNGIEPVIIEYLKVGLTKAEVKSLISMLKRPLKDLVRTKEAEFDKAIDLTNEKEVIAALVAVPKLLERPIVIKDKKAIIGRPPENVEALF